ncbi:MAG: GNAT family N-acetyltransferase [Tatlockia sp.]|nr:GNAT family N-acetyltransferase [Tatlockia sp.]
MDIKNIHKVTCGILTEPTCLNHARALLYESYIKDLAWEITHDNPSNIKINQEDGLTTLTDDFDDFSTWFSIRNEDEVIACARLCKEDESGLLEIERYENARRALKPILDHKEKFNIIELNREAIIPRYSEQWELYGLIMLKDIFEYCLSQNHTILTTSNIPDWISIYRLISFKKRDEYTFKYFDSEPLPVSVYLALPTDIKRLIENIDSCLKERRNTALLQEQERESQFYV